MRTGNPSQSENSGGLVCTIITPDYLDHAITVRNSLVECGSHFRFVVLSTASIKAAHLGLEIISLPDLAQEDRRAARLLSAYDQRSDQLRWSLKPVLLANLLRRNAGERALYVDSDVCFFGSPRALFDELGSGGVLLTPHWRPLRPSSGERDFRANFLDGLFNAGCVAATARGLGALEWWADACFHNCSHEYENGYYADQRYLDMLPVHFPGTVISRNRGFNVADWNSEHRDIDPVSGKRAVPDFWPIGMVHFTTNTIRNIEARRDPVLEPFLVRYRTLRRHAAEAASVIPGRSNLPSRPSRCGQAGHPTPVEVARRKSALDRPPAHALEAAQAYMARLESTRFRAVLCDYDSLAPRSRDPAPAPLSLKTGEVLSRYLEKGLTLGIVSRRGSVMMEHLRSAIPREHHERVLVSCFSGSATLRLDEATPTPPDSTPPGGLMAELQALIGGAQLSWSAKLSKGGQISFTSARATLIHRLQIALESYLRESELDDWRVRSGEYYLDILPPNVSKRTAVNIIASEVGIDRSTILCIGRFGREGGGDYDLLRHNFSLSIHDTSLDLRCCWNLLPASECNSNSDYYLSRTRWTQDGFALSL